jgi:4-amino-4-deoxy-L-arabinose transferase-like glycosyltransferase
MANRRVIMVGRRPLAILGAILFLALGIRLILALQTDTATFLSVDGHDYQEIARNLATGKGFAISHYRWFEPAPRIQPSTHPDLYRPPLLPIVGALLYHLPGDWLVWARLSVIVLSLGMVVLIYLLGTALFGPSIGLVAAAVLAVDPFAVHYASTWSTETLFAVCLLAAIASLAWARRTPRPAYYIATGASLGLACLARPTGLLVFAGLAVWLLVARQRAGRFLAFFPVALTALVVVTPWAARNAAVEGIPNPGTFFGPYNLWLGNNHRMHEIYSAGESEAFTPLLQSMYAEDSKAHVLALQAAGIFEARAVNEYWLKEVRGYVSRYPREAVSTLLHRFVHFFRPWPNRATTGPLTFWVALLWVVPVMGFALWSLSTRPQARDPLLLLPILLGLLGCLPFIFHLRFRFPVFDGYVAVMAAPAMLAVGDKLRLACHAIWKAPRRQRLEPHTSHPNRRIHLTRWAVTALADEHRKHDHRPWLPGPHRPQPADDANVMLRVNGGTR